jgi:WXXGXW repeat (2 copies)
MKFLSRTSSPWRTSRRLLLVSHSQRVGREIDMRYFHRAFTALLIGTSAPVALGAAAFAQTCACAPGGASEGSYVIQADEPPPPLPEYGQPPIPSPGYYWTPGYWAWNNYDYYWVPGVWVEPPQPGLLWTPGFWGFVGGVYAFTPGYWGPHVGYYGGINYGFGYNGLGYQGGRWDSGRFFYNTTVNNIGAAHITNVYRQNVVNNTTINNTSFNGGPGGVAAKPTNEELLAAKEPRVRATALQTGQARAAGMRSEQFVTTNRGKPAIAATARPGEFKGKGVVPARAAGKAAEITPSTGNVAPETKEKPLIPGQSAPTLPANAPKPGEKPSAVEKPGKPEAAPKLGEKPVEKTVKPEAAPNAPKAEEKRPAEKLAKPEPAPNPAKIEERRPAAEKPVRPEPLNAQRPPAQPERRPAQPERKPEERQCGRPGLPPCPK